MSFLEQVSHASKRKAWPSSNQQFLRMRLSIFIRKQRFKDFESLMGHPLLYQFEKVTLASRCDHILPLGLHFVLHASREHWY